VPRCGEIVAGTTPIGDVAAAPARAHVEAVEAGLQSLGIAVQRAPRLVRGLDYYLRTVFEVVSPELGEGAVICGGGRYDRLISDIGGAVVPGVGFAIGEDRLIEILPEAFRRRVLERRLAAVIPIGEAAQAPALGLARDLVASGVEVRTEVTGRSLKAGLKWAGKLGAAVAVINGAAELSAKAFVVRDLERSEQANVPSAEVVDHVVDLVLAGRDDRRRA
jgi:histidyl-tRNA synthetase